MSWTRRGVVVACAMAAAMPALAEASVDTYPLWEVRRGGATVFLFGDCGSPTDPWRSARVEAAFAQSTTFWKETPDLVPADIGQFIARGTDRDHPLSSWLTLGERDRVASAASALGMRYDLLTAYQPWLAAGALSQAAAARQKPSADPLPVLSAAAKSQGKTVRTEFPDAGSLIDWWMAMPAVAQVEYLLATIDTIDAMATDPQAWPRRQAAWASGDLSLETARVLGELRDYPQAYETETAGRNRRWPARFRAMLDGGGTTFVLVGADHLVGPESVLVKLAEAGLRARRI